MATGRELLEQGKAAQAKLCSDESGAFSSENVHSAKNLPVWMSVIQLYTEAIKRDPSLEEAKIHRFLAYRAIKMDQEALMDAENILASSRSANSCSIIGMNLRGKIGLRALEKALSLIDPNGNQVDLYAILERELKSRGSADE